jgi:ribosomal protein L16 Arg81 hydroxylase
VTHDQTAPDEPIDEFTLHAGDVLHVPRGWWHAAAASAGEPSLHLSFGLSPHTGVDLLSWLVDELRVHEVLRADVPPAGAAQIEWRGEVAKLIAERLDDPDLVPAYLSARDAVHAARHNFALPHGVTEELPADPSLRVRLTTPRAVVRRDGPTIAVEAAGQRWVLAAQAAPLIESLVAGRPATLGALAEAAGITPEQAAEVLARLVSAGVVAVEES